MQHAHQKGIIHRDLKPSNVHGARYDDRPMPKVIDFGVAKAIRPQRLTEKTMFTGMSARLRRHAGVHEPGAGASGTSWTSTPVATSIRWVCCLYELLTGDNALRSDRLQVVPPSTKCCGSSARKSLPSPARGVSTQSKQTYFPQSPSGTAPILAG